MINVAIVDDKKYIRTILEDKLNLEDNIRVLFTAENGIDFLEKMKEHQKKMLPNVVLMDIDMPELNGIDAIQKGKERYLDCKFLVLTIFEDNTKIFKALQAGAEGYLLKDESYTVIRNAIVDLYNENGVPMSPNIARKMLNLFVSPNSIENQHTNESKLEMYNLSEREMSILKLLVDGKEYKEIAQIIHLSPNTIRNHIANIYKKLHVSSKAQAIKVFIENKNESNLHK